MHEATLLALRQLGPVICREWEVRLRQQPVSSPLGLPDALVHLMDWTLGSILNAVRTGRDRHRADAIAPEMPFNCRCGANPLTHYFIAARETCAAIFERATPGLPAMSEGERKMCSVELLLAINRVAQREIETFCAVCQRGRSTEASALFGGVQPGSVVRGGLACDPTKHAVKLGK